MSAALKQFDLRFLLLEWGAVAVGVLALYVPTIIDLASDLWNTEEHGHGPIVLAVALWLLWQGRQVFTEPAARSNPRMGWALLALGLLIYILGRSQDITMFEVGSIIPVLAGTLLIQRGWPGIRGIWFALLFLLFMVPLPGLIIDALTGPLKHYVSIIAESILYAVGYPIARTGVVLTIGQYQLLVADACSGLNSMFSLTALGLLYLYLMRHPQWWRNGVLILAILPTAFVANIIRVMILVLVTYHFGDEAGQGFVHGFAGMVLFVIALFILFGLDSLLGLIARLTGRRASASGTTVG